MVKPLVFNGFEMNAVNHIFHGMWRHPQNRQVEFNSLKYWVDIIKMMEKGGLDNIFVADILGVDPAYKGSSDIYYKQAVQVPQNDSSTLIAALISATETIGLSFTSSIIQDHPFSFARRASTMDHLSEGRIGWNIVTSVSHNASQNFGLDRQTEHARRYAWAQEYVDVVFKLWEGSWEEDAILCDRENSIYVDPAKVHQIKHQSERYNVLGPHLTEPSRQRTPVLFQAGASSSGRAFAARNAEATFIVSINPTACKKLVTETNKLVEQAGRKAGDLKYIQGFSFVVGSTEEEAQKLARELDEYNSVEGAIAHLGRDLGIDLGALDPDSPVESHKLQGAQGYVKLWEDANPGKTARVRDVGQALALNTRMIGTPESIADRLEEWQEAGIDGVNVIMQTSPQSFENFIDHVLPVLRKRGLAKERVDEKITLRERLFPESGGRLNDRHPAHQYRNFGRK